MAALAPSFGDFSEHHRQHTLAEACVHPREVYIVMIGSRAKVQPTIQMAGRLRSELVQASLWLELDADLKFPSRCGHLHITMS